MVVEAVKKPTRPLAGVNVVVCLKEEKGGKKFQEKPQKGLTRPTLLEMGGYAVNQAQPGRLPGLRLILTSVATRLHRTMRRVLCAEEYTQIGPSRNRFSPRESMSLY